MVPVLNHLLQEAGKNGNLYTAFSGGLKMSVRTETKIIPRNKPVFFVSLIIFLILFLLSAMTPMVTDDYSYSFNWADWTRISSVTQIFESMAAHRQLHNGRVFAHGLVQLFLFLPRMFFVIMNAGCGVLLCVLTAKLICAERETDRFFLLLFGALFVTCFTPAFGENYLWLDGSINYFWNIAFAFLFLLPFFMDFLSRPLEESRWILVLRCILAFWTGAYSESMSLVVLVIAVLLWICSWIRDRRCNKVFLFWILCAASGYLYLMMSPLTSELVGTFKIAALGYRFRELFRMITEYLLWPYLFFAVLLTLSVWFHTDSRKILLSCLLFLSGLASLASFLFSAYVVPRHFCFPVFFTMLSCLLLLSSLCGAEKALYSRAVFAVVTVLFILQFPVGVLDVAVSWHKQEVRLQQIQAALDAGEKSVVLENYYPYTSYAIPFLADSKNASGWPNADIARYYGLVAVYGIDPPEEG